MEPQKCQAKPRDRQTNFSMNEEVVLVQHVIQHYDMLYGNYHGANRGVKTKEDAWQQVADAVNAVGLANRSVDKLEKKLNNIKRGAKTKQDEILRPPTGGGPCRRMTPAEELWVSELQKRRNPTIRGIEGGIESHSCLPVSRDMNSTMMPDVPANAIDPEIACLPLTRDGDRVLIHDVPANIMDQEIVSEKAASAECPSATPSISSTLLNEEQHTCRLGSRDLRKKKRKRMSEREELEINLLKEERLKVKEEREFVSLKIEALKTKEKMWNAKRMMYECLFEKMRSPVSVVSEQ